jgi:hypothetical protein
MYQQGDSFWGLNQSLWLILRILIAKKRRSNPQNGPGSLGTEKTAKITKFPTNYF